jgi:hypothetical protein
LFIVSVYRRLILNQYFNGLFSSEFDGFARGYFSSDLINKLSLFLGVQRRV